MSQYNTFYAQVTVNISPNAIGDSEDESNFSHKLLLTDTPFSKICKAFANDSSAKVNFSKT